MLCHFQGGQRQRKRGAHQPPALPLPLPVPEDPLAPVLARLVGHQVSVLAGGRIVSGKLLTHDPITLVGPTGVVTVLAGPAISVEF